MLQKMSEILGIDIIAGDGEIGHVDDLYFDDHKWGVRYLVAVTGNWLSSRKVLIAPESVETPDWPKKQLPVNLSKNQIEESPPVDWAKPVSRNYEIELNNFFNWTPYWMPETPYLTGLAESKQGMPEETAPENEASQTNVPQLRSGREVIGYYIHAQNGDIGHVEDFIVNDENWRIRYLVVDTRNWLPGGKKVLVATNWIKEVIWAESKVYVDLTREVIRNSPQFNYEALLKAEKSSNPVL
jgi:sporulation protein YlmC with PRC-barrel domain